MLSGFARSIEIASNQVARSDIAYHRHLAHVETMSAQGRDSVDTKRISTALRDSLDRSNAWLTYLLDTEAFYHAELGDLAPENKNNSPPSAVASRSK
jgi:hypothetical protein